MNENGLISIGEMSDICSVSKRTLRYYDTIGLVKPAFTNEENGYRYYEPYQVGRVHLVKQMQDLGISLDEVAECIREKGSTVNLDEFMVSIKKRELELAEELKNLKQQQKTIREYTAQYESFKEKLSTMDEDIHITYFDKRYLVCKQFQGKLNKGMFGRTFAEIGSSLHDKMGPGGSILPQIGSCYFGKRNSDECYNHIGFFSGEEINVAPFLLTPIDAGYYATCQFQGSYAEIGPHYEIMLNYLDRMRYERKDFCVEIYTLSPSIHMNEDNYVTELQIALLLNSRTPWRSCCEMCVS